MALTDLTRISTSGIATGTSLSGAILHGDAHFRGTQVGVTSALFDSSQNELNFKDNVQLTFGNATNGDLRLYHDGIHSHIFDNGSGDLRVTTNGSKIDFQKIGGEILARFITDGSVDLYYNNSRKFQTTQSGSIVTGILTATGFSGPLSNPSGISTFYDLRVTNNLTVEGSTTTLDTNLIGVDRVEVGANSNTLAGIAVTQSGSADLVQLYDGATNVLTVDDTGNVGIRKPVPGTSLHVRSTATGGGNIAYFDDTGSGVTGRLMILTTDGVAGGGIKFQTVNKRYTYFGNSANKLTIDNNYSRVGINSSIPNVTLDVDGIIAASQGVRVPNGSATSNYISVGDNGALRFWGTGHQFADIRAGNLHFRNGSLENILEIQQDKDIWMYGPIYVEDTARFTQNVSIADKIIHTGDTDTAIRFPAANQISFETGGSEQMKIAGTNITLGTNATTGHILQVKNRNTNSKNTNALGLDIQAAWIRIGDALSGGQTYSNGLGIKFHDSGIVHWSVGTIGSGFYISNTANSGTELFPDTRTDALAFTSAGNATFSNNVTVSNNLTVDTNTLYVNASNNRIGINTTIPSVPLDVVGSAAISSALTVGGTLNASGTCTLGQTVSLNGTNPRLQFVDTNHNPDYSIYGNNGRFVIYDDTNSAERFRINSTGKITHTYDGTAYDAQYGQFEIAKDGASNADPDWSYLSFHRIGQIGWQQGIDSNDFVIASTGGAVKNTLDAERLRIDSSGRVLIGTTTEGYADADNLTIRDSGNCGITIRSGTSNYGSVFFSDATSGSGEYDGFVQYDHINQNLTFGAGESGAPKLSITSSGYVQTKSELWVGGSSPVLRWRDTVQGEKATARIDGTHLYFEVANSEKLRIKSDGKILIGGSNTTTSGLLNVKGSAVFDDGTNARITLGSDGTSTTQLLSTTTNFGSYCNMKYQAADHIFMYGGNQKFRVMNDGKILCGDGAYTGAGYPSVLQVQGASALIDLNTTNNNPAIIYFYEQGAGRFRIQARAVDGFKIRDTLNSSDKISIHMNGDIRLDGGTAGGHRSSLDVRQATGRPPFNIGFVDGSFYRNLGTAGPRDTDNNNNQNGRQYLHVRFRTVWNDYGMTMFRITGYISYSEYTESYVGMYRYGHSNHRTTPYGLITHNQKRNTVVAAYNTTADPGYLVIVCDWSTDYMGLMFEHIGAGNNYGAMMQQDLEIIDSKRSTGTTDPGGWS